jgi:LPS export ABC transporter protein LptC
MLRNFAFFPAALFLACFTSCVNDPAKVNSFSKKDTLPLQSATDIDVLYTDSAKLKYHITAPKGNEYAGSNPYTEMPDGVKVEIFGDSAKVDSYLTANYAIHRKREQVMEAKSNVVVRNTKGETLNTEHLIWDGQKRRLYTNAFVKITTADQVIMGEGMESDERFEDYEIKNVTGTFLLKDEPAAEEK